MKFIRSQALYDDALTVIPQGSSTLSKCPHMFTVGASPLYARAAKGCRLYDVDGNEFIDYAMALSTVMLGYAHPEVNEAVSRALNDGVLFTLSSPEESQLAKRLVDLIPCADMVRFCKNGSDSCEGAVRLARAHTGRLKIMTVGGYHGFHDWYVASTPRNRGVPAPMSAWVIPHAYNDIAAIERTIARCAGEIAALIIEPVINHEPLPGFLERVRELSAQNGIVLIFDEMKTGFRLSMGGAQEYFGVTPDLAVFGKAVANGFPLSFIAGRRALMKQLEDEACFFTGSYGTERASLTAALATTEILQRDGVIAHVWETGALLKERTRQLICRHRLDGVLAIVGYAPMTHMLMTASGAITPLEIKSFLQQECARRGVLFVGYHHTSLAHTPADIERTIAVYDDVFALLAKAIDAGDVRSRLTGRLIGSLQIREQQR